MAICSAVGAASPLRVDAKARAYAPGELVVFTMQVDGDASFVRVHLFDRTTPAVRLSDGAWQALVGIDLEQRPDRYLAMVEARVGAASLRRTVPLVIVAREFAKRSLRVAPEFVNPSEEELARINREA